MHTRFRKKLVICSHDLPFYVAIQFVVVERRSHHASLTKAERFLKKKRSGHQMMHGKAPHMNLQLQGANVLVHVGLWPTVIKLNPS